MTASPPASTRHRGHPSAAAGLPQGTRAVDPAPRPRQWRPATGPGNAVGHRATRGYPTARPGSPLSPATPAAPIPSAHEATAGLVRRAAEGDHAAWTAVVEQYGALLWSVVRGFRLADAQAADAVQTTWLRLLENLDAIREPERLAGWLRTTARRACLESIRRTGRERPSDPHDRDPGVDRPSDRPDADPEAHVLRQEQVALVRRAVGELPDRHQRLLELLVASPPLSYEEIGARLGMPVGSIGPTRARLLARLRTALAPAVL